MGATIFSKPSDWAFAQWEGGELINRDCGLPLWSGKGEPPEIGDIVELSGPGSLTAAIEGYSVDDGWLMAWGTRCDGKRGNLAGAEIRFPAQSAEA